MKSYVTFCKKPFLPFAGLAFLLQSCDPEIQTTFQVDNQSSGTVYFRRTDDSTRIDTIPSHSSDVLIDVAGIGGTYGLNDVPILFGTAIIYNDTGGVSRKKMDNDINWTTQQPGKYRFEYHFKLSDEDFR